MRLGKWLYRGQCPPAFSLTTHYDSTQPGRGKQIKISEVRNMTELTPSLLQGGEKFLSEEKRLCLGTMSPNLLPRYSSAWSGGGSNKIFKKRRGIKVTFSSPHVVEKSFFGEGKDSAWRAMSSSILQLFFFVLSWTFAFSYSFVAFKLTNSLLWVDECMNTLERKFLQHSVVLIILRLFSSPTENIFSASNVNVRSSPCNKYPLAFGEKKRNTIKAGRQRRHDFSKEGKWY